MDKLEFGFDFHFLGIFGIFLLWSLNFEWEIGVIQKTSRGRRCSFYFWKKKKNLKFCESPDFRFPIRIRLIWLSGIRYEGVNERIKKRKLKNPYRGKFFGDNQKETKRRNWFWLFSCNKFIKALFWKQRERDFFIHSKNNTNLTLYLKNIEQLYEVPQGFILGLMLLTLTIHKTYAL